MKIFFRSLIIAQAVMLSVSSSFAGPKNLSANGGPASQIILKGSLVTFNASSGRSSFTLSWNALADYSCDHYEVERSLDGVHYNKMGEVKGNAENAVEESYSFKDNFHPVTGRKFDF